MESNLWAEDPAKESHQRLPTKGEMKCGHQLLLGRRGRGEGRGVGVVHQTSLAFHQTAYVASVPSLISGKHTQKWEYQKEKKERRGEVATFTDFPSQAGKTRFFPTGCFSSLCVFFTFTESASLLTFPVVECVKVFPHTKQFSLTPGCPAISLNSGTVYTEMASDSTG